MKTEELADLMDGLASFTERFGTKAALNDLRTLSGCLRQFPGETVAAFCGVVAKAKEGKPARGVRQGAAEIDQAKVDAAAAKVNEFLDHRRSYSYDKIDETVRWIDKQLKQAEVKVLGHRIECTFTAKTKSGMLKELRDWLETIKSSAEQSSFNLSGAGAPS